MIETLTQEERQLIRAWRIADERAKDCVAFALRYTEIFYYTPKQKEGEIIEFPGRREE